MGLKFLADHCVSTEIIQSLRRMGQEVIRLRDLMPPDGSQLAGCLRHGESVRPAWPSNY